MRFARDWRRWQWGLALVAAAAAGAGAGSAVAAGPAVTPVVLPRDHGAHPGFGVEWWYTAGTVTAPTGRDYFWFATVWSAPQGQVARVNVVDLRRNRIVLAREYLTLGVLRAGEDHLHVGDFDLARRAALGHERWSIDARTADGRLRLTLTPRAPYVLHGQRGIIDQGPGGRSAYYSNPRLAARGTLALGARRLAVRGLGWLDHQWGNFAADPASLRWNWFACQMRDGRDLMVYDFLSRHDRPTRYHAATLVARDGSVTHPGRFAVRGLAPFVRPAGAHARYPLRWRLRVPGAGLDLVLRARARHQFIANQVVPSFWEGASAITSGAPGRCIVESSREVPAGPAGQ